MKIYINYLEKNKIFEIEVEYTDSVRKLKKKILEKLDYLYLYNPYSDLISSNNSKLTYMSSQGDLKNGYKLSDCNIQEGSMIKFAVYLVGGSSIDNLKDEGIDLTIAKKIGFDMNLIKRNELYLNLIYFDKNITNEENFEYFNNFKVDVVGGFHAIDDITIFKKFLEEINAKKIPFIVITTGSCGKDIIPICKQYPFIKEVIIFCMNYEYNKHYIKEYPGYVKKVLTFIEDIYQYLKTFEKNTLKKDSSFSFLDEDIKMNKQLKQCPVITSQEYDKCYFLVHRVYSHFFGDIKSKDKKNPFSQDNVITVNHYINNLSCISQKEIWQLQCIFSDLSKLKSYDIFVEESIRVYTGETVFCYLFNRMMRNIESGLITLSYYMGPFLFGLNKYVREYPSFAFTKSMELYRNIECPEIDFYLYKLNLNHIICFPSLTSTSSKPIDFKPSELSAKINNTGKNFIKIKMIFKYTHENDNISPGIIIEDKKWK